MCNTWHHGPLLFTTLYLSKACTDCLRLLLNLNGTPSLGCLAHSVSQMQQLKGTHVEPTQFLNGVGGTMTQLLEWYWQFAANCFESATSAKYTHPQLSTKVGWVLFGFAVGMLIFALLLLTYPLNHIHKPRNSIISTFGSGYSTCWINFLVDVFPYCFWMPTVVSVQSLVYVWERLNHKNKTTMVRCCTRVFNITTFLLLTHGIPAVLRTLGSLVTVVASTMCVSLNPNNLVCKSVKYFIQQVIGYKVYLPEESATIVHYLFSFVIVWRMKAQVFPYLGIVISWCQVCCKELIEMFFCVVWNKRAQTRQSGTPCSEAHQGPSGINSTKLCWKKALPCTNVRKT